MNNRTQPHSFISIDTLSELSGNKQAPELFSNTALILSNLSSFVYRLHCARKTIGLTKLHDYSTHPKLEEIVKFHNLLDEGQLKKIAKDIASIREAYYLSDNWITPILIAILTNNLPVPSDDPIRLRLPGTSLLAQAISGFENHNRPISIGYPVIYPIYKVSISELKRFIDKNSKEILRAMNNLSKRPSFGKTEDATVLIGQWALYLKRENEEWTFEKVAEEINNILGTQPPNKLIDGIDARNAYERFKSYLLKHETII